MDGKTRVNRGTLPPLPTPPTTMGNDLSWMPAFARWITEKEDKGELSGERTREVDEGFVYLRSLLKDAVTEFTLPLEEGSTSTTTRPTETRAEPEETLVEPLEETRIEPEETRAEPEETSAEQEETPTEHGEPEVDCAQPRIIIGKPKCRARGATALKVIPDQPLQVDRQAGYFLLQMTGLNPRVHDFKEIFRNLACPSSPQAEQGQSLPNMAKAINGLEKKSCKAVLKLFLVLIQFVLKVGQATIEDTFPKLEGCMSKEQLKRALARGWKLARLVYGGTLFMLPLMILSGINPTALDNVTTDTISSVARILLQPRRAKELGWMVTDAIIPSVRAIAEHFYFEDDLQIGNVAPAEFCNMDNVLCEAIAVEVPLLGLPPRCPDSWRSVTESQECAPAPQPERLTVTVELPVCKDKLKENATNTKKRKKSSPKIDTRKKGRKTQAGARSEEGEEEAEEDDSHTLSESIREEIAAVLAKDPSKILKDPDSLDPRLRAMFSKGKRKKGEFCLLSAELLQQVDVLLVDKNKEVLCLISDGIERSTKDVLFKKLQFIWDGKVTKKGLYEALHIIVYNRYYTDSRKIPHGEDPTCVVNENGRAINAGQLIPRCSKEWIQNSDKCATTMHALRDLSAQISHFVGLRLPNQSAELNRLIDNLPFKMETPCDPFGGVVLNFNAKTDLHRDRKDLLGCLVVPFGDFKGGEIALMQLGVVADLPHCHYLWFLSSVIEHMNMKYDGQRGSMVFQTDEALQAWASNQNGFSH